MFERALVAGLLVLVQASPGWSACRDATLGTVTKTTKAAELSGKIFFRTTGLELDFDGSPHAYGARDQGQENICVGLAPVAPPCHGQYQGACYHVCQQTFAAWSRTSGDPATLPRSMCSVGLGGAGCSRPDVRLQAPPNHDWFVSETSLKVSPDSGRPDAVWLHQQGAQLDPGTVHYLVVPRALTQPPWNVQFGDVGIAYNAATPEPVPFIVGDGGGLGEGSVSLLAALRPDAPPKLKATRSALGETVKRYTSGVSGDFRFVIFLGTASRADGGNVTTLTAAKLTDWIAVTATAALQRGSNRDEVMACSARVPAIQK